MSYSRHFTYLSLVSLFSAATLANACDGGDPPPGGDGPSTDAGGSGGSGNGGAPHQGQAGEENKPDDLPLPCNSDKQCTRDGKLCHPGLHVCVECVEDTDCEGDNPSCLRGSCVERTSCSTSRQCSADQVCDREAGYCVECVGNNDCEEGHVCSLNSCALECASDKDCRSLEQLCDDDRGHCVECVTNADCSDNQFCDQSECLPDVCSAGSSRCSGDAIFECVADGSRFIQARRCPRGCEEERGEARCVGDDGGDGTPTASLSCDEPHAIASFEEPQPGSYYLCKSGNWNCAGGVSFTREEVEGPFDDDTYLMRLTRVTTPSSTTSLCIAHSDAALDASEYRGVGFWGRANAPLEVSFGIHTSDTLGNQGYLTEPLELGIAWEFYALPFGDFTYRGTPGGDPGPLTSASIREFQLLFDAPGAFELRIDDIQFY